MRLAPLKRILLISALILASRLMAADDRNIVLPVENEAEQFVEKSLIRGDQPDTTFIDIKMNQEAVIARDSFGNWWQYDFDSDEFIPFRPEDRVENFLPEPVEERCIKLRKVQTPMAGDVLVGFEEYVDGNIFALGKVVVSGWVKGNVNSINGEIIVTRSGQVDGEIKAPQIEIRPGGVVSGASTITQRYDLPLHLLSKYGREIVVGVSIVFLFVCFLLISLMPRQLKTFGGCVTEYRLRSVLVGFFTVSVVIPICFAVFVLTVIGVVFVPLIPLAGFVAIGMGLVCISDRLGRFILRYLKHEPDSMMLPSMIGIFLLSIMWFTSTWLAMTTFALLQAFGAVLLLAMALYSSYFALVGLGGAFLTVFGFRTYVGIHSGRADDIDAPAPAPPPIPESPPTIVKSSGPAPSTFGQSKIPPPLSSGEE